MGDALPGLQARLMSQALRKLTATIKKTNCMVIFINQIRMKIGVMFGSPETTTGGNALKFYASVRLDIRRTGTIKKGDEAIGNETKVKVVKNKVSPPSRRPSSTSCLAKASAAKARSRHGRERQDSGKDRCLVCLQRRKNRPGPRQLREFLRENPALAIEIENKVRDSLGIKLLPVDGAAAAEPSLPRAARAR
jgi:recombination protein RecA